MTRTPPTLQDLRSRTLAALSATVLLGGVLVGLYHKATAVHGYCSDHGELIHLDHPVPAEGHEPRRGEARPDHQAAGAHHCAVLSFLAQGFGRADGSADHTLGPEAPSAPLPRHAVRAFATIPRLHLAPSHSPPRG